MSLRMAEMWQILGTIALVIAVLGFAAATWRLARRERQRSEARVASLASAMDDDWTRDSQRARPPTLHAHLMLDFAPERSSPSRARALAAGGFAIMLVATLLLIVVRRDGPPASRKEAPASSVGAALELLSMRHTRDADALIVSGLVRNPSRLPTPTLAVVVSALNRDGQVVVRRQLPLDPLVLAPGKETSFRVRVSHPNSLGRYRVGFVDGAHVVPHVDRRADPARTAMATN